MKPYELIFSEGAAPVDTGMSGDAAPATENPDGRIYLKSVDGVIIAQAALWWRETPVHEGQRIGTIGGFVADDAETAKMLLNGAMNQLRQTECHLAVGPMNGNTWRRHRFVIESDGHGPFLLEPRNPPEHPGWWERAGFAVLSRYSSSRMALDGGESVPPAFRERLARSGLIVRNLDASRYDDELRRIHAVCLKSFANNFLYTPLEENAFLDGYRKVRDRVDADFVRIAERNGTPCGFVFGIPDLEAAARGEKPALIVKTLAVDPQARCAGLGSLLVEEIHQAAKRKGFTEAIHALQHETNTSLKITGRHHGRVFRRYALFFKEL